MRSEMISLGKLLDLIYRSNFLLASQLTYFFLNISIEFKNIIDKIHLIIKFRSFHQTYLKLNTEVCVIVFGYFVNKTTLPYQKLIDLDYLDLFSQFLQITYMAMKKASNYAFLGKRSKEQEVKSVPANMLFGAQSPKIQADLNVFVLTFDGMKEAEKNLAGGDPYSCVKCGAILNKFSVVKPASEVPPFKYEMKPNQSLWECQFCKYSNILNIQKEQIPVKDDVVYMLESALQHGETQNDETLIFCIDISGSMNSTSQIQGKVDLKFGMSQQEIDMLKQFMQPGDEAQFNFLPGEHNKNKTFISRKQCVLSAIQSQIQELRKVDPHKKVGFVLFNDQVTVVGDGKSQNVHIVGDKLQNVGNIINALNGFKLTTPLGQNYEILLNKLSKAQAKGQTALGPALVAAIQVASKGSKGSTVFLCTDGLANIGVGALQFGDASKQKFYDQIATQARNKNVAVNVITIKGQSSKLSILSKVVEATNGNVKVVNPEKLSEDFANILKDQVIGLNVQAKIMLHKALVFRNQDVNLLKDNKTILVKQFANATVKTKISFEYELREQEDLKFMQIYLQSLKKVPFQAQIVYTSPKGGKFLRVISSESETTTERKVMQKEANINVVHQRIASNTAAMYSRGQIEGSSSYNNAWSQYMNHNFQAPKYQQQQAHFNSKNTRMNQAISNKLRKAQKMEMAEVKESVAQQCLMDIEKEQRQEKPGFFASLFSSKKKQVQKSKPAPRALKKEKKEQSFDSDEDEMQIKNHMMEKNDDFL